MAIIQNITDSVFLPVNNGPAVPLLANGDTINLPAVFGIFQNGTGTATAISGTTNNIFNLLGDVSSRDYDAINTSGGGHQITIAATGSVLGYTEAIDLGAGGNTINNAGDITASGGSSGIRIAGTGANTIVNSGHMRAGGSSINVAGTGNVITNTASGFIESYVGSFAVQIGTGTTLTNNGVIRGGAGIFVGAPSATTVVNNNGTIETTNPAGTAYKSSLPGETGDRAKSAVAFGCRPTDPHLPSRRP